MTRYLLSIWSDEDRRKARQLVTAAPPGTRMELKAVKRSNAQNDLLWSCLSAIALHKEHCGRKYSPEVWKNLFLRAVQKEVQFIPSLDGKEFVPLLRTSDLSKAEMTTLLDFIQCWMAEQDIKLHDEVAA